MHQNKCTACGWHISAGAKACSRCGANVGKQSSYKGPWSTKIGPLERSLGGSFLLTLAGLALAAVGFAAFYVFLPVGIILFLCGGVILSKANTAAAGSHPVSCPHCGRSGSIAATAHNYRCPHCNRISAKNGDYLIPTK